MQAIRNVLVIGVATTTCVLLALAHPTAATSAALSSTGGAVTYNQNWLGTWTITSSACDSGHCCCFHGDMTLTQTSIEVNGQSQPELEIESGIHGTPCGTSTLAIIIFSMPTAGTDSLIFSFGQQGTTYNATLSGGATPNTLTVYQTDRPICFASAKLGGGNNVGGGNKGLIIGLVVTGVVVIVIGFGYWYYRKRQQAQNNAAPDGFAPLYNP